MAIGSGYIQGSETTQRESLLDEIVIRSQAETPLISTLPTFEMANRVTEWSVDRPYTSTDGVRQIGTPHENARAEGAEFTYRAASYPTRLKCIAEINHFGFAMSETDRQAVMAGMSSSFDYRSSQLYTTLLNNMETTLMYGIGSPVTDGSTTDERRTQGLISWSAWTGLHRMTGNTNTIEDPYAVQIASDYQSVFFNANRAKLSRKMFYNKLVATLLRAGARMDVPWIFHAGYKTMSLIADFLMDPSGAQINQRNVGAAEGTGYDYISYMRLPSGHYVGFRTNRYLDAEGSTFTIGPADYTPGSPASSPLSSAAGNLTFQGDQTVIGYEPGTVSIGYVRAPHFKNVPTTGDYSQLVALSEFALRVKTPLAVGGIGNAGD